MVSTRDRITKRNFHKKNRSRGIGLNGRDRLTGKRKGTSAKEKTRSEKVIEVVSRHSIGNARKQWSRFKPVKRKPKGLQRTPKKAPRNHQTGGGRGLHDATWKGHSPKTLWWPMWASWTRIDHDPDEGRKCGEEHWEGTVGSRNAFSINLKTRLIDKRII